MSFDSGFWGWGRSEPWKPRGSKDQNAQSPMLVSHREEDTTKVPYLLLTLTTLACAKPDVWEQSQGIPAIQVAVGDPNCSFQKLEAHSHLSS